MCPRLVHKNQANGSAESTFVHDRLVQYGVHSRRVRWLQWYPWFVGWMVGTEATTISPRIVQRRSVVGKVPTPRTAGIERGKTSKNQHFKGYFFNYERVIFAYKKFLLLLPSVWTIIVRTQTFLKRIKRNRVFKNVRRRFDGTLFWFLIQIEGQFMFAKCVRDFPLNKQISEDFQTKQ